jgi:hypothetical protein
MYSIEGSTWQSFHRTQSSMMFLWNICTLNIYAMILYSFLLADDSDTEHFCISVEVLEKCFTQSLKLLSSFTGASHKPDSRTGAIFEWSVTAVAAGWVGKGETEFVWLPTQREFCMFAYAIYYCMTRSGCKFHFSNLNFMFPFLMHCLYQRLSMMLWRLCLASHI